MDFNHQILIALPDMQDTRFNKAIILICEHNEDGAMGLVLNHPMKIDTEQIFIDLGLKQPQSNHIVLDGGPLNKNCGFVIHHNNQLYKSSINIQNNLTLTTSKDLLDGIANHSFTDKWQFILGYSGWTSNQLEAEIAENTWLTCPADLDLIFNTPKEQQWEKALSLIGINNYQTIMDAGHA
ncbi:MAG: YqgE/AlgH family protein [Proteobacteria bacterium]|nr:YqgE/AlgH family protein [Pseudomonadota bacterium]